LRKLLIKSIHGASQVQTMPPLYCVPFDSYQNAPLYAIFSVYKEKSFSMETLIVRGSLLLNGDFSMLMQRSTRCNIHCICLLFYLALRSARVSLAPSSNRFTADGKKKDVHEALIKIQSIVLFWHKTTCHVQNVHAFARIKISTREE